MANPSDNYKFMILLSPAKSYYSGEVKVLIAEHFSRAANGGIGAAKLPKLCSSILPNKPSQ
jgi:branched-chain amino acid aminotransferase